MVLDPVCRMQVDEETARYPFPCGESIYYFCSEGCRAEFQRHPEDYVRKPPQVNGGSRDV